VQALVGGKNQSETALGMVARFGKLRAHVLVTAEEIMSVQGAVLASPARLRVALEPLGCLGAEANQDAAVIRLPGDMAAIQLPRTQHLGREHIVVLVLVSRNRLVGEAAGIYRGPLDHTMAGVGKLKLEVAVTS